MNGPVYRCGVEVTLAVIGGKWKGLILWHLRLKTLRFSQLQRRLQTVTQKMLTQQLRELEADGLVHRQVYAEVPPKVEYSLAERGLSVIPMLELMCSWGQDYLKETQGIDLECPDLQQPTSKKQQAEKNSGALTELQRRCRHYSTSA